MTYTVLVCGGRYYTDMKHVFDVLDSLHEEHPDIFIIHGDAPGADRLADSWAVTRLGLDSGRFKRYPADWNSNWTPMTVAAWTKSGKVYNKLAGFERNQRMIDEGKPDLVVAFPGDNGTADMVKRAKKAKIETYELSTEGDANAKAQTQNNQRK